MRLIGVSPFSSRVKAATCSVRATNMFGAKLHLKYLSNKTISKCVTVCRGVVLDHVRALKDIAIQVKLKYSSKLKSLIH